MSNYGLLRSRKQLREAHVIREKHIDESTLAAAEMTNESQSQPLLARDPIDQLPYALCQILIELHKVVVFRQFGTQAAIFWLPLADRLEISHREVLHEMAAGLGQKLRRIVTRRVVS